MRVLNFGSLNIDHVYAVDHLVRPGETLDSDGYRVFPGGKGLNQSLALAGAGVQVAHAGKVGKEGEWLKEKLAASGVDTSFLDVVDEAGGHAIIQVDKSGENAIVLHGGANKLIDGQDAEMVVSQFEEGDYLLLQNEISSIPDIMECGARRGLIIMFNPAPMDPAVMDYPLHLVSLFCLNEIEGGELTGESTPSAILDAMSAKYPDAATVLTLGKKGAIYADGEKRLAVTGLEVNAADTTAAGDTFIGYLLAGIMDGIGEEETLNRACRAAAICVTREGAADSIPRRDELYVVAIGDERMGF